MKSKRRSEESETSRRNNRGRKENPRRKNKRRTREEETCEEKQQVAARRGDPRRRRMGTTVDIAAHRVCVFIHCIRDPRACVCVCGYLISQSSVFAFLSWWLERRPWGNGSSR